MIGQSNMQRLENPEKGMSLIIVITAIMILGILGWTLANLLSGDFQMNTRNLESEKALYLADAGIQEAVMHLSLGDTTFDNDTDYLNRKLGSGEYNVTRQVAGTDVNVTSRGYVPSQANYRAMRQVKVVAIPASVLGTTAFSGGYLFDWHYTRGYSISANGDIAAAHYEGSDINTTWDQNATETSPSDFAVPGSGSRIQSTGPLPEINMTWFYNNRDNYDSGDVTIKSNTNNKGIWYIKGNVTIDTSSKSLNVQHTYLIVEKNINIIGTNALTFKSRVFPSDKAYPVLATQDGNITSSAPSLYQANSRSFDGIIYSQYGTVDINCIQGVAVMGNEVRLRGNIDLQYDQKYVDMNHGFTTAGSGETVRFWQEE